MSCRLAIASVEVRRLLDRPGVRPSTVKARLDAVEDLMHDINHWCGWPALVASLRDDAKLLRAWLAR